MKLLIFIFGLLPIASFAQTKADYEHVVGKFVKFYNHKQADSINMMWPERERKELAGMFDSKSLGSMHEKYGSIKSYTYLGVDNKDPDKVTVFKIILSNGDVKATSLTLEKGNYLGTFRFFTSSPGIKKMLQK